MNTIEHIKRDIEIAREYLLESDNCTFSKKETNKSLFVDGGIYFYDVVMQILDKYKEKEDNANDRRSGYTQS